MWALIGSPRPKGAKARQTQMTLHTHKQPLLTLAVAAQRSQIETAIQAQRATSMAATHEEAKAENDKDTRATEASYLARGQALRVVELERGLAQLVSLRAEPWLADRPIAIGALVKLNRLDADTAPEVLLVLPAAPLHQLVHEDLRVRIVTPQSAFGRSLLGKYQGNEIEVKLPQELRSYSVAEVA